MSYPEGLEPSIVIEHTGQVFPLPQQTITIGAASDNAIILADPEVLPYHANIHWQADSNTYVIEELGQAGATFVNERPVEGSMQLRHGDVLRLGNTIMDLQTEPADEPPPVIAADALPYEEEPQDVRSLSPVLIGVVIALLACITLACLVLAGSLLFSGGGGTPDVAIQSPTDGTQISVGSEFMIQAVADGADDITALEVSVDGALAATTASSDANGQLSLTISKPWTFGVPGEHRISAVAYTASGKQSKTESVQVTAVSSGIGPGPTSTPTPASDQGTSTPAPEMTLTPTPQPGETAPPPPAIEYFQANPASINAGSCTTLQWGKVDGATEASIDPDVGGVSTPGSATVCPAETTTYILTARGPGGDTKASTVVEVSGALADLMIDSIIFDPNPAIQGQEAVIAIAIRNAGAGAAGAFNWEWRAGSDATFDGRLRGLNAGETTVVTVRWTPSAAYAELDTVARVDTSNEVPESDEDNNEVWVTLQVLADNAGGPGTVTLTSEAALDGYRSNDGRGSAKDDIFVGNSELSETVGEVYWRGFISFDLSSIPSGATVDSVELRFYQAKIGGDPYPKLGHLILDHVYYGNRLDDSAFDTQALESAVLAQQTLPNAWYVFNSPLFNNWLEQDLAAGRSKFQVRLRWEQETDGDGKEDYSGIESADNFFGTGNAPQLIVTYSP